MPAAKAGRVIRRQEHLPHEGLQMAVASLGSFARMFRSLWTWQRYTGTPGKTWRTGFAEARVAVKHDQEGRREAPRGQVVEERHPVRL